MAAYFRAVFAEVRPLADEGASVMIVPRIREQRWLAAPLVALLLAVVAAPAISRMTCTMGGHVRYAVGDDFNCCADDHPVDRPSVGATCCDVALASPLKADYVQHGALMAEPVAATAWIAFFTAESPSGQAPLHWLDSRPPPLPVSQRLAGIRSFLI